jgi:K+-transporting ATPase KdpF subunit
MFRLFLTQIRFPDCYNRHRYVGFVVHGNNHCIPAAKSCLNYDLRPFEGALKMQAVYIISAIIAIGLLIYLIVALLKPEWFK